MGDDMRRSLEMQPVGYLDYLEERKNVQRIESLTERA